MSPQVALLVLGALAVTPALLWFVERLLRDPVLAAALVLGLSVYSTFTSGLYPPLNVGGAAILERDVLFALLLGAGVLRLLRRDGYAMVDRLVVLLIALVAWSALRGVPANGLEPALRETRIFLYYFGGLLYFVAMQPTPAERDRIVRIWMRAAVAFAAIVLFRWAALAAGLPQEGVFVRPQEPGVRVIDAQNTLVITQALMFLASDILRREATRRQKWIAALLLPVIVGLQHRTIWLVLLLGATVAGLRHPSLARKYVAGIMAFSLTGVVALVALAEVGPGAEEPVAVQQDPLSDETIMWRVDGWRGLIAQEPQSVFTFAVGAPMGGGYARELQTSGVVRDTSPHNFYIESYLRIGIVGLAALITLLVTTIGALARRVAEPNGRWTREAMLVVVVMHAVFMLAWGPDMEQGLVLALGVTTVTAASAPVRRDLLPVGVVP